MRIYDVDKLRFILKIFGLRLVLITLGFVLVTFILFTSTANAEELSRDDKLEFIFKIKQITGHMVSALDNINNNEYALAKMHLIHPVAQHSDIVDFLSKDSICSQKLSLVLVILQHTEPEYEKQNIYKRFSHVFQVLKACTNLIVGVEMNPDFYLDLTDKLLEQSIFEYEASTHTEGLGERMKYQDALGLVIRAHMLVKSDNLNNIVNVDMTHDIFQELFLAYQNDASISDITLLTNQLRNTIGLSDSITFSDSTEKYHLVSPTVYLKSKHFSSNLKILELSGENFDAHKKVTIEYFSIRDEKLKTINGIVTTDGVFFIPFELVDDSFDESMMFTITVGDIVLYQILSIS